MKLKLSRNSVSLLNTLLRQPHLLNGACQQAGLTTGPGAPNHFKASGPEQATKIVSLRKNWLEAKVMIKKGDLFEWAEETKEYPLAKASVKLLQEILQHYQPIGMLIDYSELYLELKYALEGKALSDELEGSGDLMGEDGVEKAPDAAAKTDEVKAEAAKKD